MPSVNQIELHVFERNNDIVTYCRNHNITVMGYSPLARMQKQDNELLNKIAKTYVYVQLVCIIS